METQYQHTENGQEVRQQDVNGISKNAALADDRVLWELFRLVPYDAAGPTKYVWTSGADGWPAPSGDNSTAFVYPDSIGGRVRVRAFRCGVSSLTSADNLGRIRDIRTGYSTPSSAGFTVVNIPVNASGDPRWTLVYAKLEPDADGDVATVVKRDVTSGGVAATGVTLNKKTKVSLLTVDGAAAATPSRPVLPADAAGAYYLPLAFVLVPGGFTSSTVLDRQAIHEVAPVVNIHSATGAIALRPANQQWAEAGTVDTNQSGADPTITTFRPGAYLPSTMVGGEELIVLLQNHLAPLSHANGDVVDDKTDWRFRFFEWSAYAKAGNTAGAAFASDRQASGTDPVPSAWNSVYGTSVVMGMGQSFVNDTQVGAVFSVPDGHGAACVLKGGTVLSALGGGSDIIMLYVRNTDGALVVRFNGTPDAQVLIRLRASGPYSNHGTV